MVVILIQPHYLVLILPLFDLWPAHHFALVLVDPVARRCSVSCKLPLFCFSRLFGNRRNADLRSPCLPSRKNTTLPAVDEGPDLCPRLHCICHYCWCLYHSFETQAVKTDPSRSSPASHSSQNRTRCTSGLDWFYHLNNVPDANADHMYSGLNMAMQYLASGQNYGTTNRILLWSWDNRIDVKCW